jgi:hypothetical protein
MMPRFSSCVASCRNSIWVVLLFIPPGLPSIVLRSVVPLDATASEQLALRLSWIEGDTNDGRTLDLARGVGTSSGTICRVGERLRQ